MDGRSTPRAGIAPWGSSSRASCPGAPRKRALLISHDLVEAVYLADRVIVFSARPGHAKLVLRVDLPRPRDLRVKRDARFLEIESSIWESIREEVSATREQGAAIA